MLEEFDEEILSRLEKLNIDKRQARKYITGNQHNTVTTTYYLLLKQKLLAGGTIITADMLTKQPTSPLQQPLVAPAPAPAPLQTPLKQPLRLHAAQEPPNRSIMVDSLPTAPAHQHPRQTSPVVSSPDKMMHSPIVITSQRRPVPLEVQMPNAQPVVTQPLPQAPIVPRFVESQVSTEHKRATEHKEFTNKALMTKSEEPIHHSTYTSQTTIVSELKASVIEKPTPEKSHIDDSRPKRKSELAADHHPPHEKDEQVNLQRVTSAGSGVKLNLTVNKYAKNKTEDPMSSKESNTHRENSDLKKSDVSTSVQKATPQQRISEKSTASASKKPSSPISQPKASKMSNIYMNLKRFTSSSKVESTSSKRSKGSTKSSSHSREKITFMRTYDTGDRSAVGTARKISNPSFQSTSAEDSQTKSLLGIKRPGKDTEIRKTRNPFSLDVITEKDPIELLKDISANLKTEKLSSIHKVGLVHSGDIQAPDPGRHKDDVLTGSRRAVDDARRVHGRVRCRGEEPGGFEPSHCEAQDSRGHRPGREQ